MASTVSLLGGLSYHSSSTSSSLSSNSSNRVDSFSRHQQHHHHQPVMFQSLWRKSTRKNKTHSNSQYYSNLQSPAPKPRNMAASGEAPPPYTPTPVENGFPSDSNSSAPPNRANITNNPPAVSPTDDRYAFLSTFDTVFLIDDSGSMAGSNWREASAALASITPLCVAHDADGIDIYFLNAPESPAHQNIRTEAEVRAAFNSVRPSGATPTGQRLHSILKPYVQRYAEAAAAAGGHTPPASGPDSVRPLNVICITDGAASDDVEATITYAARALDQADAPAWQCGVQFFQVGRDPEATRYLAELDDDIASSGGIRDMVDTVPFKHGAELSGDMILKVVLGAVIRRLDRRTT